MKKFLPKLGLFLLGINLAAIVIIVFIVRPGLSRVLSGAEMADTIPVLACACIIHIGLCYLGGFLYNKFSVNNSINKKDGSEAQPNTISTEPVESAEPDSHNIPPAD